MCIREISGFLCDDKTLPLSILTMDDNTLSGKKRRMMLLMYLLDNDVQCWLCHWYLIITRYCPTLNFWYRYQRILSDNDMCGCGISSLWLIYIVMPLMMFSVNNFFFAQSQQPLKRKLLTVLLWCGLMTLSIVVEMSKLKYCYLLCGNTGNLKEFILWLDDNIWKKCF